MKRIAIGFVGLCALGALGFLALAWRSSIAPIDPPASANFPAELIAKGEALAGAGYCPLEVRPELALNTALTLPEPTNFIRVVLDGIGIRDGMPGVMPIRPDAVLRALNKKS